MLNTVMSLLPNLILPNIFNAAKIKFDYEGKIFPSCYGERVPFIAPDSCSWPTRVKPDVVLCCYIPFQDLMFHLLRLIFSLTTVVKVVM